MLSGQFYRIRHKKHHRTHPKTMTQHIKHRIIKKLFFIFYTQIQYQSRAKTTQKSPQSRRNPPFFRYKASRIGHKTPILGKNTVTKTNKTSKNNHIYKIKYKL